MAMLFTPLKLRNLEFKNRIFISPMCQFSAINGLANDWHLVHYGSRAIGGAALILVEATAVSAEGRISTGDLGLWNDNQLEAFIKITRFLKEQGTIPGIQLAHAGRKASATHFTTPTKEKTWIPLAPSPIAFDENYQIPTEMDETDLQKVLQDFIDATQRALKAGFEVIEIHMAHGYLLNEFLSPLTNHRKDQYGGTLENRVRFPLEVVKALRQVIPENLPLFVRISATEWMENGWNLQDSLTFCQMLKNRGVDFIDCSTGGNHPEALIPISKNYQVPFSDKIKNELQIATGAVGLITSPLQAEEILQSQKADAILIGRESLRNPHWPLDAAQTLHVETSWPQQYLRAKPTLKK